MSIGGGEMLPVSFHQKHQKQDVKNYDPDQTRERENVPRVFESPTGKKENDDDPISPSRVDL